MFLPFICNEWFAVALSRVCEMFAAYFSDVWILVFGHFFGLELVSTTLEITGVSFYALLI